MKHIKELLIKQKAYTTALNSLQWDLETEAPTKAKANIGQTIGYLSGESYSIFVNDDTIKYLEDIDTNKLNEIDLKIYNELMDDITKTKVIPKDEFVAYSTLTVNASNAWMQAKEENNYDIFKPYLQELINYKKKFMNYRNENKPVYDSILDDYEKGLTMSTLDIFFNNLKDQLQDLIKHVNDNPLSLKQLDTKFCIGKQRKLSKEIATYLGYDLSAGVIKESEHPFTSNVDKNDVRITTHYYSDNLFSSAYSTIHEVGHAMYEQNISDEINDTIALAGGVSMSIHESQSRFYENLIGRDYNFITKIYPMLTKYFDAINEYSIDDIYHLVNQAKSSLIRVEADELTYPFHIMIRYEVEKAIFNDEISVDELPQLWNDLYTKYLGVTPANDSEGILQDIHFSQGLFGYFPSYALGSAYASQIYQHLDKELNITNAINEDQLSIVNEYLNKTIHQYGKSLTPFEILKKASGEDFNPQYYIDYLINKYGKLYNL